MIQKSAVNSDTEISVLLLMHDASLTAPENLEPQRLPCNSNYASLDRIVTSPLYSQLKDDPLLVAQIKNRTKFCIIWTIALGDLRTARIYDPLSDPFTYELPLFFYSKVYEFLLKMMQ
jgi:hypothetical protein